MPTAFPQVTFPVLNDGQDMTAALATTLEAFVLDGNHRLLAAKQTTTDSWQRSRCSLLLLLLLLLYLKKNQNAPRPSEHPPVMGKEMSKRLGGIKGCKYKTSSWHLYSTRYVPNTFKSHRV